MKQANCEAKIEVKVVSDCLEQIDQIIRLYENAYHGGSAKFRRLIKKFFSQIAQDLKPHTRFFLYYVDNKLAAFDLCL